MPEIGKQSVEINWRKSPEFYKIIALFVCGVHDSYSTTVLLQENLNRNYSQSQPELKHSHCWLAECCDGTL